MEQVVTYFLLVQKFTNLKQKILKLQQVQYAQGKKTGFTGYVYDFSVNYDSIAVDDIKNIRMYLMKKNNIV